MGLFNTNVHDRLRNTIIALEQKDFNGALFQFAMFNSELTDLMSHENWHMVNLPGVFTSLSTDIQKEFKNKSDTSTILPLLRKLEAMFSPIHEILQKWDKETT